MKATALAFSNIALVKYWGKRDEKLFLPQNSNISVTLDAFFVKSTIEFSEKYKKDILISNGKRIKENSIEYSQYLEPFLEKVRKLSKKNLKAKIKTESNFPKSAGFASSAAFFCSLALAINKALNLNLDKKNLTILSRMGSGSACRSIYGGFVEWKRGKKKDGSDSFCIQIANENWWPDLRIVICQVSHKEKKIKSRKGMAQTVKTCPFYHCWLKTIDDDIKQIKRAILEKNFSLLGKITEKNCLKFHALTFTTKPPIIYWEPATLEILKKVIEWRNKGIESYFTIDAGPQVKILCLKNNLKRLLNNLRKISKIEKIFVSKIGPDAKIIKEHLF